MVYLFSLHRKSSEFEHLAASKARLKQEKEALEKRIAGEQEKQRQVLVKNKNLSVKLKTEKNEVDSAEVPNVNTGDNEHRELSSL